MLRNRMANLLTNVSSTPNKLGGVSRNGMFARGCSAVESSHGRVTLLNGHICFQYEAEHLHHKLQALLKSNPNAYARLATICEHGHKVDNDVSDLVKLGFLVPAHKETDEVSNKSKASSQMTYELANSLIAPLIDCSKAGSPFKPNAEVRGLGMTRR